MAKDFVFRQNTGPGSKKKRNQKWKKIKLDYHLPQKKVNYKKEPEKPENTWKKQRTNFYLEYLPGGGGETKKNRRKGSNIHYFFKRTLK